MAKPRALSKKSENSSLLNALEFIKLAQKDIGAPYQTHCMIENKWAVAFDGVVALGIPIEEDVTICPHTETMIEALKKCGQSFALTQLDNTKVAVVSGPFRVNVDCLPREILPSAAPDSMVAPLDDTLRKALESVAGLVSKDGQRVVTASVLLRKGSTIGTNKHLAIEYWHGFDLPTMCLPKATLTALLKTKLPLIGFGYGGATATFHFEGGAWLRSQLFVEEYPDIDRVLNVKSNAWPFPPNFYEGVKAVAPFNEHGTIIFGQNIMRSHDADNVGATFEVNGIPRGLRFNSKYLLAIESLAHKIDLVGVNNISYFFGDNVRGAITQNVVSPAERMREEQAHTPPENEAPKSCVNGHFPKYNGKYYEWPNCTDDCIPF